MRALATFLILALSAFAERGDSISITELKTRVFWSAYYKKMGYDFDVEKMSRSDMETAFLNSERIKKEAQYRLIFENAKAEKQKKEHEEAEKQKKDAALTPDERLLNQLEADSKRSFQIYLNDHSAINHGRYAEASKRFLDLKWKMYPSTRPQSYSSSTSLKDLESKLDRIERKLR